MALQKIGEKALTVANTNTSITTPHKTKHKTILDEDAYTEGMEKVIVRDFYPDLPRLRAQAEYLEAVETNDVEKLREIHIKFGPKHSATASPSIYSTPATFETPVNQPSKTPVNQPGKTPQQSTTLPQDKPSAAPGSAEVSELSASSQSSSLDAYLAHHTSEDNASFEDLMAENEAKRRVKHAWLYEREKRQEQEHEEYAALPSIEQQAIEVSPASVQSWKYTAMNSLMYVPDGLEMSPTERITESRIKPREICHAHTRFHGNMHDDVRSRACVAQAASARARAQLGKIGADGKELQPQLTPSVGGYGFMATPSPAPGVTDTPLMTWGEIEGTPLSLEGAATPLRTPGPQFHMPAVPRRDRLALQLAEKASRASRTKKQDALKRAAANMRSPHVSSFGSVPRTDRLLTMSAAAQRLASAQLRLTGSDRALKASYTPSPRSHRTPATPTPTATPNTTPGRPTPKRENVSLTDNLLQLPKRRRAEDFF